MEEASDGGGKTDVPPPPGEVSESRVRDPGELFRLDWSLTAVRSEVRQLRDLDDPILRARLALLEQRWVSELQRILPDSLHSEFHGLLDWLRNEKLSSAEIRLGLAQLEGWLDGVLSGMGLVVVRPPGEPGKAPGPK
ncbi:MAG: DUF2587 domain-containing protein [Actinomycetota bacterium]|nr:DUF2587 domain-containing protein [Actinomycetota bacterium]